MSEKRLKTFDRILPDLDPHELARGWRLRVSTESEEDLDIGCVRVTRERVLPEKVADASARAIFETRSLDWTRLEEIRWLRGCFGELLGETTVRDLTRSEKFAEGVPILYEINGEKYRLRADVGAGRIGELLSERWIVESRVWRLVALCVADLDAVGRLAGDER